MIYAFFPLCAAALYGLSYVLIERLTTQVNLTTYYLASLPIWLCFALGHGYMKNENFSFVFLKENPSVIGLIIIASLAGSLAWLFTTYSLKNISANYAAFGEISYPLFTILFTYLIFGARHFELTTIIGGLLIMLGSSIMIHGQTRAGQ